MEKEEAKGRSMEAYVREDAPKDSIPTHLHREKKMEREIVARFQT